MPVTRAITRRALLAGALGTACDRKPPLELKLWFGGDVHLGDTRPRFEGFSPAGAGVVNLEGPVGGPPYADIRGARVRLANAARRVEELGALGVEVASVANNHARDGGAEGVRRTREVLGRAAIRPAETARFGGAVICALESPSADRSLLHMVKADVLVVSIHVTGPPSYLPKDDLRAAVDDAVKAGARVVVAHGTHAFGPVERRGETIIAWGLGNLLFNCSCTKELEGLVLEVRFASERTRAFVTPIDAGLMGAPARPASDPDLAFDVLDSIGSTTLTRRGHFAEV